MVFFCHKFLKYVFEEDILIEAAKDFIFRIHFINTNPKT